MDVGVRLIIEDLEGSTTVVPLASEEVTIGRKEHNTIQLTEQNVSRTHAKLRYRDDGWLIEDLRSYNGVKVNGIPIGGPTVLREGDLIQIADYHLTLTDDVDRQTVDIERPRAANDDMVAMAGSSADLPSVSVDDLAPTPASMLAPQQEREQKKGAGLWIGLGLVVLLVAGVGVFFAMQKGDSKDDASAAGKADTAKQDVAPPVEPTPPQPAADTGAPAADTSGAVPAADTGDLDIVEDPADTAAPVDDPIVPVDDPVVEDPAPVKKPSNGGTTSPPKPKVDPVTTLADARKQLMSGNSSQAYKLAKAAYDAGKDSEALDVMGVAACKMGSESKAKGAYKKMSSAQKDKLTKVCTPLGITL